jgi:hypothetical protein
MTTRAVAGGLLAAAFLVPLLFMPANSLSVHSDDGSIDFCRPVRNGSALDLVFTNSMFGGDVRESYLVDGIELRRIAFVTELVASAEYYAWNVAIEETEVGYQVMVPEVSFDSIPVLVDEVGAYRLEVQDEMFDLSGMIDGPVSVTIEVKSGSVASRLFDDC